MNAQWFIDEFKALNVDPDTGIGHSPFPWQVDLFGRFTSGSLPSCCDIPTGLGKTKIIQIWFLALLAKKQFPEIARINQRLAYVVNRRTIVDQATIEAEALAKKFAGSITVSTLRGQRADNGEWKQHPHKPAIIVGTPDMIMSKLLFGGYGDSHYTRPIHAGVIGNDTLFVVDEAHLSVPMCHTLATVRAWQNAEADAARAGFGITPINHIELTATPTSTAGSTLTLSQSDYADPTVHERLDAPKLASFQKVQHNTATICSAVCKAAGTHDNSAAKVLIYATTPEFARRISNDLTSKHGEDRVAMLTGTLRGYERDQLLLTNKVVDAFLKNAKVEKTVYLVSTSAGEVGWDIDADHLVCDLTSVDSMIQRLGRVNRKGANKDQNISTVHIVYSVPPQAKKPSPFRAACDATRDLISGSWHGQSLSPNFLRKWVQTVAPADYRAAVSPTATPIDLHPHVLDAWTLTTIQEPLPCKQALADFIHGKDDGEPEAYLAWRSELGILEQSGIPINKWLEACRLQPQELMRGRASLITEELAVLARVHGDEKVILIDKKYQASFVPLKDISEIANCVVILPTSVGGLRRGMLDATSTDPVEDVADKNTNRERRTVLVHRDDPQKLVARPFVTSQDGELRKMAVGLGMAVTSELAWETDSEYSLAVLTKRQDDTAPTATSLQQPTVDAHNLMVADKAVELVRSLGLSETALDTIEWAARCHDLGKADQLWQRAIGNHQGQPLAKSGPRGMNPSILGNKLTGYYRHEFGSLAECAKVPAPPNIDLDLALYLIACHHGYGRPHFRPGACGTGYQFEPVGSETPRRFADLQHRFGRWGLAWLHSIFCLADQRGS
jgi:CRISPR-associated endonuclease/helicase Cas3